MNLVRNVFFFYLIQRILMHSLEEFNLKSDLLMERFRSLADGKTVVTLFNEINRAALDIIASVNLF
jgi:hypothetical protein